MNPEDMRERRLEANTTPPTNASELNDPKVRVTTDNSMFSEIHSIIKGQINRHVAMTGTHRAWLGEDIAQRVCGLVASAVEAARAEHEHLLRNLLARVFRDGGHKTEELGGVKEAACLADGHIAVIFAERDQLQAELSRVMEERIATQKMIDGWEEETLAISDKLKAERTARLAESEALNIYAKLLITERAEHAEVKAELAEVKYLLKGFEST